VFRRRRWLVAGVAGLTAVTVVLVARSAGAAAPGLTRVDTTAAGVQADGTCWEAEVNRDGTWVVFQSYAMNLLPPNGPFTVSIFAKNTSTGQLELASANPSGDPGNSASGDPAISADGRYVVFSSTSTDLVANDTNGYADIFRRDLVTGTTELVSRATNGDQADRPSTYPSISGDGRYVTFQSLGENLPDGTRSGPMAEQVYRRDMVAGTTIRISQTAAGVAGNEVSSVASISENGRFVAYASKATNLVVPDANGSTFDIYWHDTLVGLTLRASVNNARVAANGYSAMPAISGDGRLVAYYSRATNLGLANPTGRRAHVYVRDITTQTTTGMSMDSNYNAGNADSFGPAISYDGRYVSFNSEATNLVPQDGNRAPDVFVRDRVAKTTVRVSLTDTGAEASGSSETGLTSYKGAISSDGTAVVFDSDATDIVMPDANGPHNDVFLVKVPGVRPTSPPDHTPRPTSTATPTPTWSDPRD
jgi:Tol biopolymer transport system component